jgi:hypothetical protein
MVTAENKKSEIEQAGDDLVNFAIDREDIKWLVSMLPEETTSEQRSKVEYELQLLKIISVGWSIPYFLENNSKKNQLMEIFWESVREFSKSISETTSLMTGQDIDYFQVVKNRLDMYVRAMSGKSEEKEPVAVIGPEFAVVCGAGDDIFVLMTGSKMFSAAVDGVREYLTATHMI